MSKLNLTKAMQYVADRMNELYESGKLPKDEKTRNNIKLSFLQEYNRKQSRENLNGIESR